MQKNYKSLIFYFLMNLILVDFGNQIAKLSFMLTGYENPLFMIVHLKNTGSAFGLFQNASDFLAILGIIAVIYIGYYIFRYISFDKKLSLIILTLFSGGTTGNMLERLINGYVNDYIKLKHIDFAVFNAFDVMISLALFIYVIFLLADFRRNKDGKA